MLTIQMKAVELLSHSMMTKMRWQWYTHSPDYVLKNTAGIDVDNASGPDGIPAIVFNIKLLICFPELALVLTRLLYLSLKIEIVPNVWKLINVQPVPKKGSRADQIKNQSKGQ